MEDMVVLIHFGNAKRGNINLEDIVVLKESPKTIEEMLVIIFGTAKRGYIYLKDMVVLIHFRKR